MASRINHLRSHIIVRIYTTLLKDEEKDIPRDFKSHIFVARITALWPTANDPRWYKYLTITFLFVGMMFPLLLFVNNFFLTSVADVMSYSFSAVFCATTVLKAGIIYLRRDSIRDLFRTHVALTRVAGINTCHIDRMARMSTRMHVWLTSMYIGT